MKSPQINSPSPAIQHSEQPFFSKNQVQKKPFFAPEKVQTKLTIGQPGDKYEQEADSVADHVVNKMSQPQQSPSVQMKCPCEEGDEIQRKPDLMAGGMEEEESLQMQPMEEEEEMLQPKLQNNRIQRTSQDLEQQLNSAKGGGAPLPADIQTQMEAGIGANFSGVKVHTGGESAKMNQNLNAQAFTHGKDIFFNEGKYDPSTTSGKHLLAHELTHVVQQNGDE